MPVLDADTLGPFRKPWLLPVLMLQGKLVRMRALRLPEPSGPREGVAGGGTEALGLLVLGDSAAAGVGVSRQADGLAPLLAQAIAARCGETVRWRVLARTGVTAAEAVATLLPQLAALPDAARSPDLLVTSLGVNDAMGLSTSAGFTRAMRSLIAAFRVEGARPRIILGRVPPLARSPLFREPLRGLVAWRIDRINALLASIAAEHEGVTLAAEPTTLDAEALAADGFHPGPLGYRAWAEYLAGLVAAGDG